MKDQKTTIEQLKKLAKEFVEERDWQQFHSPKNLSCAITVEASELLEKFTFVDSQESFKELETNRQEIEDELADVVVDVSAPLHGGDDGAEVVVENDDVGGLLGDVGAGVHGEADVGELEGGGVVRAVAGDSHGQAGILEGADDSQFVFRIGSGENFDFPN